jgi:hypothetical protein
MKRLFAIATALSLVVAACGGDTGGDETDGGDQTDVTSPTTTSPASDEAETTSPPAGGGDEGDDNGESEGSGPSAATVTVGDETYNFSSEGAVVAQCLTDMFGIFSIQLLRVDDSGAPADGAVQIVVLHEGTDPAVVDEVDSVRVDVGDETWVADEADDMFEQSDLLEPGMSQVDSVEIDGRTVRGTATFFRRNSLLTEEVETATGSFEATCGEERMS